MSINIQRLKFECFTESEGLCQITAHPNSKLGADTKCSEVKECRIEEEERRDTEEEERRDTDTYRPLSRRLDRCDRVIQNESRALTYINYWTEHSSNDSSAEVQGAAVTYYVPSWAAPCPIFICSLNLEQSMVDSCPALSTLRPQIAMVWSNCLFVVEI